MIDLLTIGLRLAGAGLILLAILHVPIARHLKWSEDRVRMSEVNAAIFHVHMLFICLALLLMGLPALLDPGVFLERSRAAAWGTWSLFAFWAFRLWCQWLVYPASLWRGRRFETRMHWLFSAIWAALMVLFGLCAARQMDWLP